MKKLIMVVSLLVGLGLAGSALAQTAVQSSHPQWDKGWQTFLNNHPRVRGDVTANPNVILDPNYRRAHPQLMDWMKAHPRARSYLLQNGGTATAPHSWMTFLQAHPNYQQYYYQNPYQFADPAWVNQHPDFHEYCEHHPDACEDLRDRGQWWQQHHDYDGWRWRRAWNDQDEDEDRDEHWEHHPPGHAYGWEKHHAREEWEEHEAAEHAEWRHHDHGGHGHGHGHGHHDDD